MVRVRGQSHCDRTSGCNTWSSKDEASCSELGISYSEVEALCSEVNVPSFEVEVSCFDLEVSCSDVKVSLSKVEVSRSEVKTLRSEVEWWGVEGDRRLFDSDRLTTLMERLDAIGLVAMTEDYCECIASNILKMFHSGQCVHNNCAAKLEFLVNSA